MSNTPINVPVTAANVANAPTVDLSNYGPRRTFSFVGPANSICKFFGSGDGTNFPSITSTPLVSIAANSPPITIDDLCLKYRAVPTAIGTVATVDCEPSSSGGGGAAFLNTCQVADKAAGGLIGAASATVDVYEVAQCSQTTAGQDLQLPDPTDTTASRRFYLFNSGSVSFAAYGSTVSVGGWLELQWSGGLWEPGVAGIGVTAGSFSAAASVVTAAAQFVPGSGAATSTTLNNGILLSSQREVTRASFRFAGDAANVAGQTATMVILKNGVAIPGATTGAQATTAGQHGADVTFTPVILVPGDVLTCTFTPSALLTAVCTNVLASIS